MLCCSDPCSSIAGSNLQEEVSHTNPMTRFKENLKTWLRLTAVAFVILVVIFLALPLLFLLLRIPSFEIGQGVLWLVRWQNDSSGNGIEFNLVPLLIVAAIVGVLGVLVKLRRDRSQTP